VSAGLLARLGLLVPELEQAIETFLAFGYELADRGEPVSGEDGRVLRTARLVLRNGPDLVLEQLDGADGEPLLPRWGLDSHPCWYVDEMPAAVAALRERGMAIENAVFDRFGPEAGEESTYIHFPTAWGMDVELISNPRPIAYESAGGPLLWHPSRPGTWGEGDDSAPVGPPDHGIPTNRGTAHMGMRVPDLEQAIEFFVANLGCELAYRHPPLQRSGGRWTEIPERGEVPEPDRSVADERFPHGTRIRVGYVRCANFNFELMELRMPGAGGELEPVFDAAAAAVMHPVFAVDSVAAAAAALEAAGASREQLLPASPRLLTPWGQAIGLCEQRAARAQTV
jgi:catechol 2,3-dioxygenase-like lactoylglutathione lyase family enzyme